MRLPSLPKLRLPILERQRRPPKGLFQEQAPAEGLHSLLGHLSLFASADDPPPGGDGAYRKMQHDPQVKACLNTKKYAVLSRGWEVHPASEDAADVAVADFVRWCLDNMATSPLDALYDVLDALAMGYSLVEINYELIESGPWRGMIGLKSLKAKDPQHFVMQVDEFYNIQSLRVAAGMDLDPAKFLLYTHQPKYSNPFGNSDLRAAYRSWYMKERLLNWWAKYLEKFGMPTVVGSYDGSKGYTTSQQMDLLRVVSQVHNEAAVVIPSDQTITLLEAQRSAVPGFDEAVNYLDRAMAKSILGQTLTSDSNSRTATYALGAVHQDVLRFYINKLTRDLEQGVMGKQLISRLVALNFAPGTACPSFHLGRIDDDKLAIVGNLINQLVTGGVVAPDEPWIREYLGLPAAGSPADS